MDVASRGLRRSWGDIMRVCVQSRTALGIFGFLNTAAALAVDACEKNYCSDCSA